MGLGLLVMVFRFSRTRKANAERVPELDAAIASLDTAIEEMLGLDDADMAAFGEVLAAWRLPKESPAQVAERDAKVESSLEHAMAVPMRVVEIAENATTLAEPLTPCVSRNIIADLATGVELLSAAARSAHLMIAINATSLRDRDRARAALLRANQTLARLREARQKITHTATEAIDANAK